MIDIDTVTFRNFLSYGDYDTTVKITGRGECFIHGKILENDINDEDHNPLRSNGAGKSSPTQAILWCISGKTMYDANPGDGVRCWFSKGDTCVKIRFKDGSELVRTRGVGDTHLLYSKAGKSVIDCTLSTSSNQQAELNRLLNYDHGIFCGSVFSSQFKKKWMSMGDQSRKQIIERVMGIERVNTYAQIAKTKREKVNAEQEKLESKKQLLSEHFADLLEQEKKLISRKEEFEASRHTKKLGNIKLIEEYNNKIVVHQLIDVVKLQSKWDMVIKVEEYIAQSKAKLHDLRTRLAKLESDKKSLITDLDNKINSLTNIHDTFINKLDNELNSALNAANSELNSGIKNLENIRKVSIAALNDKKQIAYREQSSYKSKLEHCESIVSKWEKLDGKLCLECEQVIPHQHIEGKIIPIIDEIAELKTKIADHDLSIAKYTADISTTNKSIDDQLSTLSKTISFELGAIRETAAKQKAAGLSELKESKDKATQNCAIETQNCAIGIKELQGEIVKLQSQIDNTTEKLAASKPKITVSEANSHNKMAGVWSEAIVKLEASNNNFMTETNPFLELIADVRLKMENKQSEIDKLSNTISQLNLMYNHLHYIYSAYSDRRKIKSFLVSKHQPYFNGRLHHYLDLLGLDLKISLTSSLSISSNMWDPKFQCGGERARTDLAFTFAVFDLHFGIYGRQCNFLVLDEPDDGLDEAGVQSLINIIQNDLSPRFETIFVISHMKGFKDVFASELYIERIDRLSRIAEDR